MEVFNQVVAAYGPCRSKEESSSYSQAVDNLCDLQVEDTHDSIQVYAIGIAGCGAQEGIADAIPGSADHLISILVW